MFAESLNLDPELENNQGQKPLGLAAPKLKEVGSTSESGLHSGISQCRHGDPRDRRTRKRTMENDQTTASSTIVGEVLVDRRGDGKRNLRSGCRLI